MTPHLTRAALAAVLLLGTAAPAAADVTVFLGFSPTPETRSARGFAAGITMTVIGFEFDYAQTRADEAAGAPSLHTGTLNAMVMTPTRTRLYLSAGAGFYRESFAGSGVTHVGTSIGGGVKAPLLGPLQVRVDYRLFQLRGRAQHKRPQRFYVGLNLRF